MSLLSESYRTFDPEGEVNYGFSNEDTKYSTNGKANFTNEKKFDSELKSKSIMNA